MYVHLYGTTCLNFNGDNIRARCQWYARPRSYNTFWYSSVLQEAISGGADDSSHNTLQCLKVFIDLKF